MAMQQMRPAAAPVAAARAQRRGAMMEWQHSGCTWCGLQQFGTTAIHQLLQSRYLRLHLILQSMEERGDIQYNEPDM